MDTTRFDAVARLFASGTTRRDALRGLVAGAAAVTAGGVLLTSDDASAKRRRRRKNKKNHSLRPGQRCERSSQCQTDKGYICEVAVNAGNSDKTCSGGPGAVCGPKNDDLDDTAPFCAVGHECVDGVCQATPEEL